MCAGGITTSVVADLAPDDARARYQAALGWARGAARFLSLAVGPALYAAAGPGTLWWTVTAVGLGGAVATLALGPRLARRNTGGASGGSPLTGGRRRRVPHK